MNKTTIPQNCHFCGSNQLKPILSNWIIENHYLGKHERILKEVLIGTESTETREPINIVYYCSMECMGKQFDKEEAEDWAKGDCQDCQGHLAIINENCQNPEHLKEANMLPINTPDCLKKTEK